MKSIKGKKMLKRRGTMKNKPNYHLLKIYLNTFYLKFWFENKNIVFERFRIIKGRHT